LPHARQKPLCSSGVVLGVGECPAPRSNKISNAPPLVLTQVNTLLLPSERQGEGGEANMDQMNVWILKLPEMISFI